MQLFENKFKKYINSKSLNEDFDEDKSDEFIEKAAGVIAARSVVGGDNWAEEVAEEYLLKAREMGKEYEEHFLERLESSGIISFSEILKYFKMAGLVDY